MGQLRQLGWENQGREAMSCPAAAGDSWRMLWRVRGKTRLQVSTRTSRVAAGSHRHVTITAIRKNQPASPPLPSLRRAPPAPPSRQRWQGHGGRGTAPGCPGRTGGGNPLPRRRSHGPVTILLLEARGFPAGFHRRGGCAPQRLVWSPESPAGAGEGGMEHPRAPRGALGSGRLRRPSVRPRSQGARLRPRRL